jgi:RHS repeat-associated protein
VRVEGKGPSGDDRPIDRAYDADGRLATETQGDEFVRWRHDALGRPTRRSTSWGARDLFHWKINGLNGLVDPLGGEHSFQHDAWSRRLTWRQAGGLEQTTRYDDLDRLVADQLRVPGGDVFVDRRLVWADDDTVTHEEQRTTRGVKRLEYQYDAAGRLLGRAANDGPPVSFEYDVCDNLTTDADGTKRTYQADRLLGDDVGQTYRHDTTGRMVARQGPEGTLRLWFDDRDRLVRVHTGDNRVVHHRYDALGRRVETLAEQPDGQVTEETFYWDDDQLARRVVRRPQTRQVERDERYTYDPERPHIPLFRVVHGGEATETTGEIQYYTTDQRGAAVRLSAADGKALWAAEYDPYGRLQRLEGDEPQPIRLMGQLHDEASDLSHHRYRVFDPQAARFISPDPLGLVGGDNAFGYPTDPVAWADPLGLARCRVTGDEVGEATNLPVVRPGTPEWNAAVRALQQGGKGDIRVESIADAKAMLQQARGNMDRRKRWTETPYRKGYEVHPNESHTANAPGNNLSHIKWRDNHSATKGSGHIFFNDPDLRVQ